MAVVAFLFDAYNKARLLSGIERVLVSGGVFVGTLPHVTWGQQLRRLRGYSIDTARFQTRSGGLVEVDSLLLTDRQIASRLREAGLELLEMHDLSLPKHEQTVSPDILAPAAAAEISPYEIPILKLVVGTKL